MNGMDRALSSYQPFSATHGPGGGFDTGGEDFEPEIPEAMQKTKQKNLYENFVKERDREERGLVDDKQVAILVFLQDKIISYNLFRLSLELATLSMCMVMEYLKSCSGQPFYSKAIKSTTTSITSIYCKGTARL